MVATILSACGRVSAGVFFPAQPQPQHQMLGEEDVDQWRCQAGQERCSYEPIPR